MPDLIDRNALLSEVARQVVETDLAADVLGAPAVRGGAADQRYLSERLWNSSGGERNQYLGEDKAISGRIA